MTFLAFKWCFLELNYWLLWNIDEIFLGLISVYEMYQMTLTWTSGYGIDSAEPFVEWGPVDGEKGRSPAVTLTFDRSSMCGECCLVS